MREIDNSRRGAIHSHLQSQKVKDAFNTNIADLKHSTKSAYNDGKSDEENSIKWTLKQIYYEKCAFCESYIKNEVGDIEHFRPKNKSLNQATKCDKTHSYYWLAFSWDNLLPSCSKCNGKKSNCFDIQGTRVSYQNESLDELHDKIQTYNQLERPKLLHPEYDTFENDIKVTLNGEFESTNDRATYTIEICDLNRTNLVESREKIIGDFENKIARHLLSYYKKPDLEYFSVTIEDFIEESKVNYSYSLVRKYIKENFEDFLQNLNLGDIEKDIVLSAFEVYS